MQQRHVKKSTSWGKEAEWYRGHLEESDTYHVKVVLPHIRRIVAPHRGQSVLEIGCGEGFFSRELAREGARVIGSDIASELIALAREKGGGVEYHVSPAQNLSWVKPQSQDVVLAVLTLQNMEKVDDVMKEVARVLKKDGRFVFVLNHPVLRVPQAAAWGYDEEKNVQYRRIDEYLTGKKVSIDMHPGKTGKTGKKSLTYSFHRSLQDYMKVLRGAGFAITRLEEWISHKTSEPGPRAKAENTARKEFPLFMMIEATPLSVLKKQDS